VPRRSCVSSAACRNVRDDYNQELKCGAKLKEIHDGEARLPVSCWRGDDANDA